MSKEPRDYFEEKSAALINELKAELDELEYNAENVPWDPGSDEHREFDDLRIQLQDTENLLHELKAAADPAWPAIRDEMEKRLGALNEAVGRRLSKAKL
jgi:ElaB/YqjD/DUF883 family membrane-anchored ribosome-binding protein